MRIERRFTSISWIPTKAIEGLSKGAFEMGPAHYDEPPPEHLDDLDELRKGDRFRFANELAAWIEVDDNRIVGAGYSGGGKIGATTLGLGKRGITVPAVALHDIQAEPQNDLSQVKFTQTCGGRTGVPMPRPVKRKPFFQIAAPIAWTTLSMTIKVDGSYDHSVLGASPFPRHWFYDDEGKLVGKSTKIDFKAWASDAFGDKTPWGEYDSPALVAEAESSLERELSYKLMEEKKPEHRKVAEGDALVSQGDTGSDLYLLLDGAMDVEVDGDVVAQVGPGAILGERAILEGGTRTSTVRAVMACRVAVFPSDDVDREVLSQISKVHSRER